MDVVYFQTIKMEIDLYFYKHLTEIKNKEILFNSGIWLLLFLWYLTVYERELESIEFFTDPLIKAIIFRYNNVIIINFFIKYNN